MATTSLMSRIFRLLLLTSTICCATVEATGNSEEAAGNLLQYREGNIILAGLMRVHKRGNEACSVIQKDGIQAVETMNMIIDQVNDDPTKLPGIKLGTLMVDTCDVDSHALQRVVIDILPLIWNVSIRSSSAGADRPTIPSTLIAGVVGSASSAVSIQVANLLQVFEIPQVSYWSTSPDLSNKARYKHFFRVVPSDTNQASAMIALAKQQGWNYISVVYEDDFYGVRGFTEIKELAAKQGLCIATSQPVPRTPKPQDFRNIVKKLVSKAARAIIVFTKRNDASDLMLAAQEMGGETNDFIWIGSDGWSRQIPLSSQSELDDETINGAIGFQPKTGRMKEFDNYFTNLTLGQNLGIGNFRNPWFAEYISKVKNCNLVQPPESNGKRLCRDDEKIDAANFDSLTKMESVADSVLSFVNALDNYHKKQCGGRPGLCEEISKFTGTNKLATGLYDYLKNVSFEGINGRKVEFDDKQDGPAVYNILNYKSDEVIWNGGNLDKWVQAGTYESGNITWEVDLSDKVYETDSVCSKPCDHGEATIIGTEICCWHCQPCRQDEYVSANGTQCVKCDMGHVPDENKTTCVELRIDEMSYDSVYGIACICVGAFGLLCTLIVTAIYIMYRETAIVKASGRELCFFVLFGVFLTFLNFLSMTASPTVASCVISRVLLAIGPTCMYAGMLTKTVRVVIIFQSKNILSERVKTFIRPGPQVLWTLCLVMIQVIVLVVWFAISIPRVEVQYPTSDTAFRACAQLVDIPILIGLIYPFLLILICTILATINRNVPTGFNETQYIGFSMYTTCVIWLAFLPIFITNPSDLAQRVMTTSICLSLSATTVLICLFGPRCFTILFHPEENTQQSVMSSSVDKGGRPASMANISSQASAPRTRNSIPYNSNNNNNNSNGTVMGNGTSWRAENVAPTSPWKSLGGYSNGSLVLHPSEVIISQQFNKLQSIPQETVPELYGGEDERF